MHRPSVMRIVTPPISARPLGKRLKVYNGCFTFAMSKFPKAVPIDKTQFGPIEKVTILTKKSKDYPSPKNAYSPEDFTINRDNQNIPFVA